MKKFLSLVLAMVMTFSLVTISAGATEYKDLTDKNEIQYEEAVAVLNRIGIITGYEDGSFRPETELTRGAAAKIIVSLLIGPDAAAALPNATSPYPDVPASHTFAGVISYCKTAGIISGYGDGTFKPANSLTGYAFAKMLLGAIGYKSDIEGFTDTGWTMNVAKIGNLAGLFNRLDFDGAASVNREQACQLALNTLKATMVEYTGGFNVTAGDATVVGAQTRTYVLSNQSYATNISNRKASNVGNAEMNTHYTVEFGEEHFKDLRLVDEHGTGNTTNVDGRATNIARDEFGRPANEWSYKKVTIGTFPIEPDFVYTTQVIHRDDTKVTDANKVRALGLNGYELESNFDDETRLWVNGQPLGSGTFDFDSSEPWSGTGLGKVADIADYTDNGTVVEIYVSEDDADFIQDVVVVKTQLMSVKALKSESVSLKIYDDKSDALDQKSNNDNGRFIGYNQWPIDADVNDVEIDDDAYATLKDMKAGDIVAVVPVWVADNSDYDVSKAYAPETVSGELTNVETYGQANIGGGETKSAVTTTVGGTDYKIALWNKDLYDIDGTKIRVTRKDVTLYLDEFGNALLAKDVGSTSNFMIVGGYHSGVVDGAVVTFVDGWDIKGNEISLNVGNIQYDGIHYQDLIGQLVHYRSNTSSKYAEWTINHLGVFDVASQRPGETAPTDYSLKASSGKVLLNGWTATSATADNNGFYKGNDSGMAAVYKFGDTTTAVPNFTANTTATNIDVDDSGVKVIYVTMDTDDNEVDSIEIKDGMQSISHEEIVGKPGTFAHYRAQACVSLKDPDSSLVKTDSVVKAIVIKQESGSANLSDLVYISNYIGSAGKAAGTDKNVKPVYGYEAHFIGKEDYDKAVTIYSYKDLNRGDFARARLAANAPTEVKNVTEENFYNLTKYGEYTDGRTGEKLHKALSVLPFAQIRDILSNNKTLLKLTNYDVPTRASTGITTFAAKDAVKTNVAGQANITLDLNDVSQLDLGDSFANSIVSINKAKFIDLTDNDVDNATDLKDLWNEVSKTEAAAGKHRLITVSLIFNDKYDDDSFRDVYAIIITNAPKNATYIDNEAKAGTLSITGEKEKGFKESNPVPGSKITNSQTFTVTVNDGYRAKATKGATYVSAESGVYTFQAKTNAETTGVEIEIEAVKAGSVSTDLTDRYGSPKLTINNSSVTVKTDGSVSWIAEVTVPAWVNLTGNGAAGDIAAVDYTVYDGTTLKGTAASLSGTVTPQPGARKGDFILSGTGTGTIGIVSNTSNVNVKITAIRYAKDVIKYYEDEAKTKEIASTALASNSIESLTTDSGSPVGADTWLFGLKEAAYKKNNSVAATDLKITGASKIAATVITSYTAGTTSNNVDNDTAVALGAGGDTIFADDTGYVEVVVPNLEAAPLTYTLTVPSPITVPNGTGTQNDLTFVTVPGTPTVDAGHQVTVKAFIDSALVDGVYGYNVTAVVKNAEGEPVKTLGPVLVSAILQTNAVELGKVQMDGNYKIEKNDVTIVPVTTPLPASGASAEVKLASSGKLVTVKFDRKIVEGTGTAAVTIVGGSYTASDIQVVGDDMIQFSLDKAAGSDITGIQIGADTVQDAAYKDETNQNENLALTITVTCDGKAFTVTSVAND